MPSPAPNWYIGGGLGVNQLMDTSLSNRPGSKVSSYVGPVGVISLAEWDHAISAHDET